MQAGAISSCSCSIKHSIKGSLGCVPFSSRTFRCGTFRRGTFRLRAFHRTDTSPYVNLAVRIFCSKDTSPWKFLPCGHFAVNYVKALNIGNKFIQRKNVERKKVSR